MHPEHSAQLSRLNRVEGQVRGIRRMIEERRYCVEILTQLKAARAALHGVEQAILKTHVQACLKAAVTAKAELEVQAKIDEVMELLSKRI